MKPSRILRKYCQFGLSEKHTKFEINLPHGFDKSVDLLSKRQNHEEDFFKLCVLLKKSELYLKSYNSSIYGYLTWKFKNTYIHIGKP